MIGFQIRCPKCTSTDCRRSRSGWVRYLTRLLLVHPLRCRRCEARFWRFAPLTPAPRVRKRKPAVVAAPHPEPAVAPQLTA
jgi:hypothetical protein